MLNYSDDDIAEKVKDLHKELWSTTSIEKSIRDVKKKHTEDSDNFGGIVPPQLVDAAYKAFATDTVMILEQ